MYELHLTGSFRFSGDAATVHKWVRVSCGTSPTDITLAMDRSGKTALNEVLFTIGVSSDFLFVRYVYMMCFSLTDRPILQRVYDCANFLWCLSSFISLSFDSA